MSYFITKYALSDGIYEVSEAEFGPPTNGRIYGKITPNHFGQGFGASDWTYSRESAIAQADAKRLAKIASVKKSLAKLEKLDFFKVKA